MYRSVGINYCTIYTILWCLIHLKGVLYSSDAISVILYGIVMLMSLYFFIVVLISDNQPKIIKSLNMISCLLIFYGLLNIIIGGDVKTSWNVIPSDFYLKNILNSVLPIYSYYYFAKNGYITKKWILVFTAIFLLISFGRYYLSLHKAMALKMSDESEVTNNAGYIILSLLPLVPFLYKKPILQYFFIAICAILIVAAMKRGAILICIICIVFFFLRSLSGVSMAKKIMYVILSCILIFSVYYYVIDLMATNTYFEKRIEDTIQGNTSQRDTLYATFLNFMFDRNIFFVLFGQGADTTIRIGPNYAHNDWLEIGVNQGLLGVTIYAIFMYSIFCFWLSLKKSKVLYTAIGIVFIILFVKSFISMSINNIEIYIALVIGYAIAAKQNRLLQTDLRL